ncbi:MAG: hypothetical protein ACI89L_000645 [Phycisphaerales bacterium]|jgi:hypothetical protein
MNVASAMSGTSLNLNGTGLQNTISVRVARQALDNAQMQGDAMVSLISSSKSTRAPISARPTPVETGRGLDVTG